MGRVKEIATIREEQRKLWPNFDMPLQEKYLSWCFLLGRSPEQFPTDREFWAYEQFRQAVRKKNTIQLWNYVIQEKEKLELSNQV